MTGVGKHEPRFGSDGSWWRPLGNRIALALILGFTVVAEIEALGLLTHGRFPISTGDVGMALLAGFPGGLCGAVVYAIIEAGRRSRLTPLGVLCGAGLGVVVFWVIGFGFNRVIGSAWDAGQLAGIAYMLLMGQLAAGILAVELGVVLLLLWGLAELARRHRAK